MARVISGIQPTGGGIPHLGNYLGALRGYVDLQDGNDAFYCVADLHATTVRYDPSSLGEACLVTAASLLACGVDPARARVFRQSAVRAHAELALVLSHVATLGPLERMTQFKEKGRVTEGAERDEIGFGLLSYPVLMAADILLYRGDLVPVGDDQHQHLQLCASLATRFNSRFGVELFRTPKRVHQAGAARVMSLRDPTRKMSKSDPNPSGVIHLTDGEAEAADKYRRATADSEPLPGEAAGLAGRPAASNLVGILAAMTRRTEDDVCREFGGRGFAALKDALVAAHVANVVPIGERMAGFLSAAGRPAVREALALGAADAAREAEATMRLVREAAGLAA